MDGTDEVILQRVHLGRKDRHIGILVQRPSQLPFPRIEVTGNIDAETERNRRFQHRNVVLKTLVEMLYTTHSQAVTVKFEHKRKHFQQIVPDDALDRHVVDGAAAAVPEHQRFGDFPQFSAFLQFQVGTVHFHNAIHAGHDDIHAGIDVCRGRHFTIQHTLERLQHGQNAVHGREEGDYLIGRNIGKGQVETGFQVFLGTRGIETLKIDIPHIGSSQGIGELDTTFFHEDIRSHPVDIQVGIINFIGLERHLGS